MKAKLLTSLTAVALSTVVCNSSVYAVDSNWKNLPEEGNWSTASNWNNGIPDGIATISQGAGTLINSAVGDVTRLHLGGSTLVRLTIASGGSLSVTENGRARLGVGAASKIGELVVNGGSLTAVGRLYLGAVDGTQTTLTVKNGGIVTTNGVIGMSNITNQTSTLNIGGESTAEAAGWINAASISGELAGAGSVNTLNFNHTSTRYTLKKGAASDAAALAILGAVNVNVKAGVTVLTGTNTYTGPTTISNGAVLLANHGVLSETSSSTGLGAVTVQSGGELGGVGYVGGNTVVNGTLRPGDHAHGATDHGILKFNQSLTLANGSETLIGISGTNRGTEFDAFNVTGSLTLAGTLEIELLSDFEITSQETYSFQLFSATGGVSGSYSDYLLPELWEGLSLEWDTTRLSSEGLLSVTAIPEPSSLAIGLSGGIVVFLLRRKTRKS